MRQSVSRRDFMASVSSVAAAGAFSTIDLSALQGKTVNVTGTIAKSEKGMTINATKVEAVGK